MKMRLTMCCGMMLSLCAWMQAAETERVVAYDAGKSMKLVTAGEDAWRVEVGDVTYDLKRTGANYVFTRGPAEVAKGEAKADKVTLSAEGKVYLHLKLKADKIKVSEKEDTDGAYEIKFKSDKVKVAIGEEEFGKVKHYPDTGKLKAKDAKGAEVAVTRGAERLSAVLTPFLMKKLSEEKRVLAIMLMMALGK